MRIRLLLFAVLVILFIAPVSAQKKNTPQPVAEKSESELTFTPVVEIKATPVKNQAATGTCWCFATTSFIESELLRMGKGEYDLSEMFVVRYNYVDKLQDNYLRQGKGNISEGSLAHDWMRVFRETGIVPDEVPVQRKNESDQYHKIVDAILDSYLGKKPESFTYKGSTYTPKTFAASLGINPSDYVEITSFTHFPFYTQGLLEVPDNWAMERFYNVPLDELMQIMDNSLNNGYTVNWDGDVSEKGFTHKNGVAVFPEQSVSQELRQSGYENFTTTDDHLMHLTGIVKDQNGVKYYVTKNSWGPTSNSSGGFLNMSENFVRAKTIYIMVNKNAVPAGIRTKLGI